MNKIIEDELISFFGEKVNGENWSEQTPEYVEYMYAIARDGLGKGYTNGRDYNKYMEKKYG